MKSLFQNTFLNLDFRNKLLKSIKIFWSVFPDFVLWNFFVKMYFLHFGFLNWYDAVRIYHYIIDLGFGIKQLKSYLFLHRKTSNLFFFIKNYFKLHGPNHGIEVK